MSVNLIINGSTFAYPQTGDTDWGNQATQWAQAVTAGLLPKLGGTFLITGNVDFGNVAGLSATYFASNNNITVAPAGFLRMANADKLEWISTNATDTYGLTVDSTNLLRFYVNTTPFKVAFTDLKQSFTKAQAVTSIDVASSSGTLAIDVSASNNYKVLLTENISTITISNPTDGEHIAIIFKQGASAFTVAWPASFVFIGTATSNPAVTTVNTKVSLLTGFYNSELAQWLVTIANQS